MAEEQIIIRGRAEMDEINQALAITGQSFNQFNKQLNKNFMVINKNRQVVDQFTGRLQDVGKTAKNAALMGRRFKFEWLSIMFAGMALNRVFGGLISQQFKLWGVTEMTAAMWNITMLPTMEKLTPAIFALQNAIMNLPDPIKEMIGEGILLGWALGIVTSGIGQVMLALGGLKILFGLSAPVMLAWGLGFIAMIIGLRQTFYLMKTSLTKGLSEIDMAWGGTTALWLKQQEYIIKGLTKLMGKWNNLEDNIKNGVKSINKDLISMLNPLYAVIKAIEKLGKKSKTSSFLKAILKSPFKLFGISGYQTGGLVAQTGPAFLHAGERVIPKGRSTSGEIMFAPTVYINASVSNEMDVKTLADKLNRYWASDFERLTKGRGN